VLAVPPGLAPDRLAFLQDAVRHVLTDPALGAELANTPYYIDYQDAGSARRAASATVGGIGPEQRRQLAEIILRKYR
jgi:hypothetical protein